MHVACTKMLTSTATPAAYWSPQQCHHGYSPCQKSCHGTPMKAEQRLPAECTCVRNSGCSCGVHMSPSSIGGVLKHNVHLAHVTSSPLLLALPLASTHGHGCSCCPGQDDSVSLVMRAELPAQGAQCTCSGVARRQRMAQQEAPPFHKQDVCTCMIVNEDTRSNRWNNPERSTFHQPTHHAYDQDSIASAKYGEHCRSHRTDGHVPDGNGSHVAGGHNVLTPHRELFQQQDRQADQCVAVDPVVKDWQQRHLENLAMQKIEILGSKVDGDRHNLSDANVSFQETSFYSTVTSMNEEGDLSLAANSHVIDLTNEITKLQTELRMERVKAQFYQVMLQRSREDYENLQVQFEKRTQPEEKCDVETQTDVEVRSDSTETGMATGSTLSLCEITDIRSTEPDNEISDSPLPTTTSGVDDTDEGNVSENRLLSSSTLSSPIARHRPRHHHFFAETFDAMPVSSMDKLVNELERKTRHLAILRRTLKELSASHQEVLEKNFQLEEHLKLVMHRNKPRPNLSEQKLFGELCICLNALKPVVRLCLAALLGNCPPDVTECFGKTAVSSECDISGSRLLIRDVKSLKKEITDLRQTALDKLFVARYVH